MIKIDKIRKIPTFAMKLFKYTLGEIFFKYLFGFLIIFSIGYICVYFYIFNGNSFSDQIEDFSGFGSYISGIGSIFSVFSLLFLIWTYRKDQNKKAKEDEENKLFKYFDYVVNSKNSVQGSYHDKQYTSIELCKIITQIIYSSVNLLDKTIPQTITINKIIYSYTETQLLLIQLSGSFVSVQNLFIIIMKYIYEEIIDINRKDSLTLLLAVFTYDEIVVLLSFLPAEGST